jgi:predicted nucleic acid-binding protein
MAIQKIYWDTSCFIAYLSIPHPEEQIRALVCRDILHHAQNDKVELVTSSWTIVETIRPKLEYKPSPIPQWADALEAIS